MKQTLLAGFISFALFSGLGACKKDNGGTTTPGNQQNTETAVLRFKVDGAQVNCNNDISGSRVRANNYLRFSGNFDGGKLTVIAPKSEGTGTLDFKTDPGRMMTLEYEGESYSLRNTPAAAENSSGTYTIREMQTGSGSSDYPTLSFEARLFTNDGSRSVTITEGYLEIKK